MTITGEDAGGDEERRDPRQAWVHIDKVELVRCVSKQVDADDSETADAVKMAGRSFYEWFKMRQHLVLHRRRERASAPLGVLVEVLFGEAQPDYLAGLSQIELHAKVTVNVLDE